MASGAFGTSPPGLGVHPGHHDAAVHRRGPGPGLQDEILESGAEGQILVGGIVTAGCMIYFGGEIPTWLLLIVMALASIIAGGIWGLIPAVAQGPLGHQRDLVYPDAELCGHPAHLYCGGPVGRTPSAPTPWASSTQNPDGWFPSLFGQTYGLNVLLAMHPDNGHVRLPAVHQAGL